VSEPVRLRDLLAYQDQAIVSRILLKKETGSVTLFAFADGQSLSEHTVPFDAWVHVLEGTAEIAIEGHPHVLGEGEAMLMPAGKPHAVRARTAFKMVLAMIRG
jgi:quercetin dioxygenase-like cupin family protein